MKKIRMETFGINIEPLKMLLRKPTARCPVQYIGVDDSGQKKLVVYSSTTTERFYQKRSVELQKYFTEQINGEIKVNCPIVYKEDTDGVYVIYDYFENVKEANDITPINIIRLLYEKYAKTYEVNDELIEKISNDFLSAWPSQYHERILELVEYKIFIEEISKLKQVDVFFQHGDYTPNNILVVNENLLYLMDFEFSMKFQPIGFDLYDWHYATDKVFEEIPYLKINEIKENLQNRINYIIDSDNIPQELVQIEENDIVVESISDRMVYNQYDVLYDDSSKIYMKYDDKIYFVHFHSSKGVGEIAIWMKDLPQYVFEKFIELIFYKNPQLYKIKVLYSASCYKNQLEFDNNWVIQLPNEVDLLLKRLKAKTRYNIKRERKQLEEEIGKIEFFSCEDNISDELIQKYFDMKRRTHGTDYHMSAQAYIEKYHVTDAYYLMIDEQYIAILFACINSDTVYLENLSYDDAYAKYSPGFILYEYFLEDMIRRKVQFVFLGNGKQPYKKRFSSEEYIVYSGEIYRNIVVKNMITLLKKIKRMFIK